MSARFQSGIGVVVDFVAGAILHGVKTKMRTSCSAARVLPKRSGKMSAGVADGDRVATLVEYVYHAPHALRAVSDSTELAALASEDAASLASSLAAFLSAAGATGDDMVDDVFVLPLTHDGAGTHDLARRKFLLHEIVDDIEFVYASDLSPLARPSSGGRLRVSPILQGVALDGGDRISIADSQTNFVANLAPGSRVVLDAPTYGEVELTVDGVEGSTVSVSGWGDAAESARPGDGANVAIVAVVVQDPEHVRTVRAFHDWRGHVLADGAAGHDDADTEALGAGGSVPTAAVGDAVVTGSVAVSGTDASGTVYIAVGAQQPNPPERGASIVAVTFSSPHATAPTVALTPANGDAASIVPPPYAVSGTTGFTVRAASPEGALAPATVYAWNFFAKSARPPIDRRPVKLAEFNEGLYRLLYAPTDTRMASMPTQTLFEDYLAHPERIACERDMAKVTGRSFDVTIARTALAMARGAVLTFQGTHGGAVAGLASADDVDDPAAAAAEADRLVPTLAAVLKLIG